MAFNFAYISDTQATRTIVVRSFIKSVYDITALDPQPDFVLFGAHGFFEA